MLSNDVNFPWRSTGVGLDQSIVTEQHIGNLLSKVNDLRDFTALDTDYIV